MYVIIEKPVGTHSVVKQVARVVRVAKYNIPSGINDSVFNAKGDLLVGTGLGTYMVKSAGASGKYLKYDPTAPSGISEDIPSLEIQDNTNYLLNGGFTLAQRQAPGTLTTIANHKYSADRWMIERENADLQYVRQDGSSESGLVSPHYGQWKKITNAGKFLLCQPLEYLDTLKFRGKTLNFQLQMKASSAKTIKIAIVELQAAGTADTLPATVVSAWGANTVNPTLGANLAAISTPVSCAVTTAWQTFQFSATFPTTSKNLLVMVWTDSQFAVNDTLSLAEAGLYFGATQRSWTPRPITLETTPCLSYYRKSYNRETAPGTASIQAGLTRNIVISPTANTVSYGNSIIFPVPMRVAPAVTVYGFAGGSGKVSVATVDQAANSGNTTDIGENGFLVFNNSGGNVTGSEVQFHYVADAEIY